jgi:hypothetical protein
MVAAPVTDQGADLQYAAELKSAKLTISGSAYTFPCIGNRTCVTVSYYCSSKDGTPTCETY